MTRPDDTSPDAWDLYLRLQRERDPGDKLFDCLRLSATLFRLQEAEIRARNPGMTIRESQIEAAARRYGRELVERATRGETQ